VTPIAVNKVGDVWAMKHAAIWSHISLLQVYSVW